MEKAKVALGVRLAELVSDGQLIGVGTGSTVAMALSEIGKKIAQQHLKITALVTSYQSALACSAVGIEVRDALDDRQSIAWGFDGADEFDAGGRLIKGQGGAMLREKILAAQCPRFIVVADSSKRVDRLGARVAVPVEVVPEAFNLVRERLFRLGALRVSMRDGLPGKHGPVITEKGNLILDALFLEIERHVESAINNIPGVVENGIFTNYASEIWMADDDGVVTVFDNFRNG